MMRAFLEGGPTMWLVLLLGLAGHAAAVATLVAGRARRRTALVLGGTTFALAAGTALIGWLGYVHGVSRMEQALVNVAPDMRNLLEQVGRAEAAQNIRFGLIAAALPAIIGFAFLAIGAVRPDDRDPALP
jgi:hypothetical protein